MGLKQGTLLKNGEYRIEKVLGQGGFGITYLAVQVALDRKVAIKEFFMKGVCERDAETSQVSISNADNKELVSRFREKFLKEARSLASLEHRNIVSVIDVFECNGTAYYVMKHLGGASLADKVKQGALPEDDAVRYISQVASALEYVHGRNMMHLDVKPANILLDDTDNAVLIDFGHAKQYDTEGQQTSTTPVGISHGYAPMEQYRRGGVSSFSPASDIYSLGATLYKLVTGATPPEASDVNDEGLPVLPSDISLAVRTAIEAAMQPKRKDRPQSIADFLAMIEIATSKDESGKSGGSDDCPPLLRGTSVAEAVNESPATDDGETVVENSADTVISNNSRSCHPERSEESHPTNKEILPSSGCQNDKIVNGRQNDNANSNKRGCSWILILLLLLFGGTGVWQYFDFFDEGTSEGEALAAQDEQQGISTDQKVDLGLSVYWAGWNVGTSSPEGYGDYYAWGETTTKNNYSESSYQYYNGSYRDIGSNISGTRYDVARAQWGDSWRMPTEAEMQELVDSCTWTWTTYKGVPGCKVTGPNGNSIFLSAAGYRDGTGGNGRGGGGYYWSGTLDESYSSSAYGLYFNSSGHDVGSSYCESGHTVRPVSD